MFFYEDGFGIKWPTKVDMSLNKETKLNHLFQKIMTKYSAWYQGNYKIRLQEEKRNYSCV